MSSRLGRTWILLVLALTLAVWGCSSADDHPATVPDPSHAAGGAGGGSSERIAVDATDGTIPLSFHASVTGTGTMRVGSIAVTDEAGSMTFDGAKRELFLYKHQPWPDHSLDLLQGLVVESDRWLVVWFYCASGTLTGLYYEGTHGPALAWEPATGTCAIDDSGGNVHATLPAVDMSAPPFAGGYAVSGPEITIPASGAGSVVISGETMEVYSFSTVDCSTCDTAGGWYELHAVLWDPSRKRACFAIFYLVTGGTKVEIAYSISLPDLGDPAEGLFLDGTWTKAP